MPTTSAPARSVSGPSTDYFVYLGAYGKGVYAFRFSSETGAMEPLGLVGEVVNPSFVTTDRGYRHLLAVSELEGDATGGVASFSIDRKTGKLTHINSVESGGGAPCHLSVDHSGRTLVVANYVTGGVSAFPIAEDGRLGAASSLMTTQGSGPNKERQDGPHAHEAVISNDNKRVYVPDLGLDRIRIYHLEPASAKLVPNDPPYVQVEPGHGPRHIVFDSASHYAYVLNELKPVVMVFSVDKANGSLHQIQTLATLSVDFSKENTGAELRLDHGGKFLYTSNRGDDSIQVFAVDHSTGKLQFIQRIPTAGQGPRGFNLDPSGKFLLVGNQKSNNLVVFAIDAHSGNLTATGQQFEVPSPVDVFFVPAD